MPFENHLCKVDTGGGIFLSGNDREVSNKGVNAEPRLRDIEP